MTTRRAVLIQMPVAAIAGRFALRARPAFAAGKRVTIGIDMPLTGSDAENAKFISNGALMAVDEANAAGGVVGYHIDVLMLDNGTATAGQYDPAQSATNARKMVSDPSVVAALGPMMSGSGKAMAPILSEGDLATISPSSTNPDITDPKFASAFRPMGKVIYFRTVTTDAYQGPGMANYIAEILKAKTIYILDDSSAYGIGLADAFEDQARTNGMTVAGRDRLDPQATDYMAILSKVEAHGPEALYFGGTSEAGIKLAKQAYDVLPKIIKAGGDGVFSAAMLKGAGFPAMEGWYVTMASPYISANPDVQPWIARYKAKFGPGLSAYSFTAYDAMLVILDSIRRVAEAGKPVNRSTVRDAIQAANVKTLQRVVSFDKNGDIANKVISVFQCRHRPQFADDDVLHQYQYVGVAPHSSS
ncbi:MAG TPA: branched-chain amino acid ABC transporter substrate-binding protein [Bradyrhizobium sp.]|nr:branched-chain amino acid ABC transporter substrate-binding protein [Bradyrhizobium sp.]